MKAAAAHKGSCEHCTREFLFELVHNGLNESSYAYCSECGITALLDTNPTGRSGIPRHRRITAEGEDALAACPCGGKFTADANPRCPNCRGLLGATRAGEYIEAAINPVAAGWRWQGNWDGLYCMIVQKRVVRNRWKTKPT